MFRDVISQNTTLLEWEKLRIEIHDRISATMGRFPDRSTTKEFSILDKMKKHGLVWEKISFEIFPNYTVQGALLYSEDCLNRNDTPAVLCLHETDHKLAHRNVLDPLLRPNTQYGIELARRGYFVLAVDQFGYSLGGNEQDYKNKVEQFYSQFPDWSLDGMNLIINQSALNILANRPEIDDSRIGCIGHSLGGRLALYLAAFDSRIRAAVVSNGISPNLTNLYRNIPGSIELSPLLNSALNRNGKPIFEYQELLSLVAPRAILLIEPWNDPYNPYIEAVLSCFEKARHVYELYCSYSNISIICHGDGHTTIPNVRCYAYSWFDRYLKKNETL